MRINRTTIPQSERIMFRITRSPLMLLKQNWRGYKPVYFVQVLVLTNVNQSDLILHCVLHTTCANDPLTVVKGKFHITVRVESVSLPYCVPPVPVSMPTPQDSRKNYFKKAIISSSL